MSETVCERTMAGHVAVVTGGASGMGSAICVEFARHGSSVIIADRNIEASKLLAQQITAQDGQAYPFAVDVSRSEDVARLVNYANRECGFVDILVNNAGVRIIKPFLEHSDDDWRNMLDINLTSQFLCARALAPSMLQKKWGRIINIASIASFVGRPNRIAYCVAKAGILGLTRSLAVDLRHSGVTANAIAPGSVATPLNSEAKNDKHVDWGRETAVGRWGEGADIAKAALYLASEGASYVNGTTLVVDGGWISFKDRDGEIDY